MNRCGFHFGRGRTVECSLEVLQFILSDWEVMDKITGRAFGAEKCGKNCFTIKKPGFEAKFDLVHADYKQKGSFRILSKLIGNGLKIYYFTVTPRLNILFSHTRMINILLHYAIFSGEYTTPNTPPSP